MSQDGSAYVQPFTAAVATQVALAGGKGATLARLFQAGLPIPPGCVVTSQALINHLQTQGWSDSQGHIDMPQAVLAGTPPAVLQEALRGVLHELEPAPHGWAVRSSAVAEDGSIASFAGIYESFLEIPESELWPSIQACWASWWSPRAMAYRERLGNTAAPLEMAVVIQAMVPARCAGVAFTVEPMRGDPNRMVINAAPGLGVAVVSGVVEPEQIVLSKGPDCRVLETRLQRPDRPPLLPTPVCLHLGALLQHIEELCGTPQDVEWAWDGSQVWIVQSRAITTLPGGTTATSAICWTNANLKDVMPGLVSPFTWSLMQPELDAAMRDLYAQTGYTVPPEQSVMRRFWGRPYFNMSLFVEAGYRLYGTPPEQHQAQMGGVAVPIGTPHQRPSRWQRWRWLRNGLRFMGIAERTRKAAPASFAAVERRWQEERQQAPHLERMAILQKLDTFDTLTRPFLLTHLFLTSAMSGNFSLLKQQVERLVPEATASGLVAELVTGIGDVSSADHSYHLWELSCLARQSPPVMTFLQGGDWSDWRQRLAGTTFLEAWQTFLDAFGHRSLYEVEMANPRWREQPDYLFNMIASYAALEQDMVPFDPHKQRQRRQAAEQQILQRLICWRRWWIRRLLHRTQEFSRLRENSKSHLVQLIDIGRCFALAAACFLVDDRLLSAPEAIFLLTIDEVKAALCGQKDAREMTRLIAQRRLERQRWAALQPPEALIGDQPYYAHTLTDQGSVLRGLPSSPGRVTGTARVLRSPQEGERLQAGEILIAPSTDPGWTPLFLLAAGLVMETGGYLSHGAIVAREYGIPSVLNVPLATQRIPDGRTVCLDGAAGTVQLITEERSEGGRTSTNRSRSP